MMVTEHRVGGSKCDYIAYFKVQIIKYGLKISEKSVLQGADRTPSILQLPYCRIMLSVCILPLRLPHENYSREESSSNVLLWTVQMYFSLFLINVIAPRIFFFYSVSQGFLSETVWTFCLWTPEGVVSFLLLLLLPPSICYAFKGGMVCTDG